MTTPYRDDLEALQEKKADLQRELEGIRATAADLERLRTREAELSRELASVDARIGQKTSASGRRALPMLDRIRVASPCNESWDEMLGDDRVRFCTSCEKNVFNLSAMPREDAERLLEERLGGELCVRFYQRADGTILTEDCPVGVSKKRRKKVALAAAGAGAMALAATSLFTQRMGEPCPIETMGEVRAPMAPTAMGTVEAAPPVTTVPPVNPETRTPHVHPTDGQPPTEHVVMGRRVLTGKSIAPTR